MKAVDPTIKIGAVLTMPANWPDGMVGGGDAGTWNQVVLTRSPAAHRLRGRALVPRRRHGGRGAHKTGHVDDAMYLLRRQIDRYAGRERRPHRHQPDRDQRRRRPEHPAGRAVPRRRLQRPAGERRLHRAVVERPQRHRHVSTVAGQTDYGDFGMLSSGTCLADGTVCEPPLNTPFAPVPRAEADEHPSLHPGDQLVRAGTDDPLVTAHAARRPDGDLQVLLINKDPDNATPVTLDYRGYTPRRGRRRAHLPQRRRRSIRATRHRPADAAAVLADR
jgi:hypothetical protein